MTNPFDRLPSGLPSGRLISPKASFRTEEAEPEDAPPVLWITERLLPHPRLLYERLLAEAPETGLWPLLLQPLGFHHDGDIGRPWFSGELLPRDVEAIDIIDPERVLREHFPQLVHRETGEPYQHRFPEFPGLAAAARSAAGPEGAAGRLAGGLCGLRHLGLVLAARGADALAACGWTGPCNYFENTQDIAAVVRGFEDRFGATVVGVGFASLDLSVARPPRSFEHAVRVAAEHLAFCVDNFFPQDWREEIDFDDYAKTLIGSRHWHFWWD